MPELAEVEFFRRQWDCGLGQKILKVQMHARKRVFRGTNTPRLARQLLGQRLLRSTTRGKQMLLEFSGGNWLGIHLGMSGALRVEPRDFARKNTITLFCSKVVGRSSSVTRGNSGASDFTMLLEHPHGGNRLDPKLIRERLTRIFYRYSYVGIHALRSRQSCSCKVDFPGSVTGWPMKFCGARTSPRRWLRVI